MNRIWCINHQLRGQPGPIYAALYAGYQAAKAAGDMTDPITA